VFHQIKDLRMKKNCRVYWNDISKHQQLSEEFIREFKYVVDWKYIPKHQQVSKEFIREFE